jgi:hypothetical protein
MTSPQPQRFTILPSFLLNDECSDWKPKVFDYSEISSTFVKSDRKPSDSPSVQESECRKIKEKHRYSEYFSVNGKTYFWVDDEAKHGTTNYYELIEGKEEFKFTTPEHRTFPVAVIGDKWFLSLLYGTGGYYDTIQVWENGVMKSRVSHRGRAPSNSLTLSTVYSLNDKNELIRFEAKGESVTETKLAELKELPSYPREYFLVTNTQVIVAMANCFHFYDIKTFKQVQKIETAIHSEHLILVTQNLFFSEGYTEGRNRGRKYSQSLYQRKGSEWYLIQREQVGDEMEKFVIVLPKERKNLISFAKLIPLELPFDLIVEVTEFCVDS